MKKRSVLYLCYLALFLSITAACATGFTGPGGRANAWWVQTVTVSQLDTLGYKAQVKLTGNIVRAVGREYYTFQDATGEITVEIERTVWWGKKVGPADTVEITAKMERKKNGRIELEVKKLRKV